MVKRVEVEGYDALRRAIANENKNSDIFVLFCGSKTKSGDSWCSDCVKAKPIIEKAVKKAPEDSIFINCEVGNREFWKDPKNVFRVDKELQLKCVPTLMKWGQPQKLEESQCFDENIVMMMFED